jgi:hypothetical protein
MSSSTSGFDESAAAACRRWLLALAATLAVGLSTLYIAILIVDPFGTGYFTPIERTDIVAERYAFANATRVRDQQFDAAIIGNSRMMRLAPQFLDPMTGSRFVMLAMPALGPEQQATVASVFDKRHERQPLTLVWGVGDEWCLPKRPDEPLPYWLYEPPGPTYLMKLFSPDAARHAWRRSLVMLGLTRSTVSADGYEPLHPFWNRPFDEARFATIGRPVTADTDAAAPSLVHLSAALAAFRPDVRVLFVVPPVFAGSLPVPGSEAEIKSNACKSAIRAIASARPRTGFLDLTDTNSLTLDPQNFVDAVHFQDNVARDVERRVADVLRGLDR